MMRKSKLITVSVVLFVCLMVFPGCNDHDTDEESSVSNIEFKLEKYGTWDYSSFLNTAETDFYYDPDSGMSEAITIDTAEIGGTNYLILTLDPTVGPGENSGLFIFDIENPVSPRLISSIVHPDEERKSYLVRDIAIQDDIVYAGLFGDKGLWIVDITEPASPLDIGISQVETNDNVLVSGDYLFSSGQLYNGIIVCDISVPGNAKEVKRLDIPTRDCCLELSGDLLFLGIRNILTIYDVSTPGNPKKIIDFEIPVSGGLSTEMGWEGHKTDWSNWAHINDIQISDNYVYVAFGAGGVRVIDISDPESPEEIKTAGLEGFAVSMTVDDDLLYLTKSDYEDSKILLEALDISEPDNPLLIDSVATESDFILGGVTFAYCWSRPQITGHYVLVPGMRKIDVFRRIVIPETERDNPVSESPDSQKQLPEMPNLELAQQYYVIGERGLAIEDFDRSVGRWLIMSDEAYGIEGRAQTAVQVVIDLYNLYQRDYTSVILIPEEGIEGLYYASASFAADGLGPEGMTGSAPANHFYWKLRTTDYVYSERELEIARLWQENIDRFPQTDPLSSCSYDEEALKQHIADTLGISYEEASFGNAKMSEYNTEALLSDWTREAAEYHTSIVEPEVTIEPKPGHLLGNDEGKTGIILGNVRVESGVCDRDYFSSSLDSMLQKGQSCLIVSGNITNLDMDKYEIALWGRGCDESGTVVSETLDATHISGQIGIHLETNETCEFILHMNPGNGLKEIRLYGASYLITPP
jgi:hypothetical protein